MKDQSRLLGIVLCGGRSARMGSDKSLLAHPRGGNYLQFAIQRLTGVCDRVCVSGNPGQPIETPVIADPVQFQGPATGVAAALQFAQRHALDACLITPVDMPFVTTENLQSLVDQWNRSHQLTIAQSVRPQPLLGIYPVSLATQIQQLAGSEHRSLSGWLKSQTYDSVTFIEAACRNINTPQDLADES